MQNASHGPHACDSLGIRLIKCNRACCQPTLATLPLEAPLPSLLCSWGSLPLLFPTQAKQFLPQPPGLEEDEGGVFLGGHPKVTSSLSLPRC